MEKINFTPQDDLIHLLYILRQERKLRNKKPDPDLIKYQRNSLKYNLTKQELETEIDELCNKYNLHE